MKIWYMGPMQIVAFFILCGLCYYEFRNEALVQTILKTIRNLTVVKGIIFAMFWIVLTILSCLFIQVRYVLIPVDFVPLLVWFVLTLKNIPNRTKNKKQRTKKALYDAEDIAGNIFRK